MQAAPIVFHPVAGYRSSPVADARPPRRLSVCLINPKFEPSVWGFDYALPLIPGDKRCWVVTGALPALASLAPPHCDITLVDENIEEIDFALLDTFDVVGVTGMIVQRERMVEILQRLKGGRATVVVGGPYASVAETAFEDLCDVIFIGEAEETWPAFLLDLGRGNCFLPRYEQAEKTSMETVPTPRYDLVKAPLYTMASLQFSRGCPFLCEFCDIITIFGRKPRLKTPVQMTAEFDAVLAAGFQTCFLVDDNFIGNKVKAKELLRALGMWQKQRGYPITLVTEASINLADDAEMIELMVAANFRQVFIGIESPRKESLLETRKNQNVRGDSLLDKVQRIRDGGLVIQAGFIVGFDNDTPSIFEEQYQFIQASGIAQALISILTPIPTTPLYDRLKAAGRLDFSDPHVPYVPKGMSRETLKAGYDDLMRRLFEPKTYFERMFRGYAGSPEFRRRRASFPAPKLRATPMWAPLIMVKQMILLVVALLRKGELRKVGGAYLRAWNEYNRPLGKEALPFAAFVSTCVVQWHFYRISRFPRRESIGTVQGD